MPALGSRPAAGLIFQWQRHSDRPAKRTFGTFLPFLNYPKRGAQRHVSFGLWVLQGGYLKRCK